MISALRHVGMVVYTIVCILTSMVLMIFYRKIPLIMARNIWAPGLLFICRMKYKVTGTENVKPDAPYIYMVNHISHLDIPIAVAAIPDNIHFVAKKSLGDVPFLGWYIKLNGMILIDRSDRAKSVESLEKAGKLIRQGRSVIIFPEGTRSKTGEMAAFKKGGFHIALSSGVDIIPVNIQGTEKSWKPGSSKVKGGVEAKITIGKPINTKKYSLETLNDFVKDVREKVVELV